MTRIVNFDQRQVDQWRPHEAQRHEAEAEAVKRYARDVKDWALLDQAVDQQIADQRRFVDWWDENVGVRLTAHSKVNAELRSPMSVTKAEELSSISQQKVSRWRERLDDIGAYRAFLRGPSYRAAMDVARGTAGTGEFERYTPAAYIEMARSVMGTIDIDPASSEIAQKTVKARRYFTEKDDGLAAEWCGNVWLNPPYHRELGPRFISKLITELNAGRTAQAILLTNNSTDAEWFRVAQIGCQAICFPGTRIAFLEADGATVVHPTQGQSFFYYGAEVGRFCEVFHRIGFIALSFYSRD